MWMGRLIVVIDQNALFMMMYVENNICKTLLSMGIINKTHF